jgi:hypothetical protein
MRWTVRTCEVDGCDRKHSAKGLCQKHYDRKYCDDNREKRAEYARKYSQENRGMAAKCSRKYRENNKEKVAEYDRKYRENNKEKVADKQRKYHENNKEKRAEYGRKNREDNKEKTVERKRRGRESLCYGYIKDMIRAQLGVKNPPQELIDAKRVQLRISRELKKMDKTPSN